MTTELLLQMLGWCSLINYMILLMWFIMFMSAHDWLYNIHSLWFNLSKEKFDHFHYISMAIFKLLIFVFNLTPYIALRIIV